MARPVLQAPEGALPERILLIGGPGAGKTFTGVDIATRAMTPDQTMYVIDTEGAFPVVAGSRLELREAWEGDGRRGDGEMRRNHHLESENGTVVRYWCDGWDEERYALNQIWERAQPGDWLVIDSITHLWADVQSWWVSKVRGGVDYGDFIAEVVAEAREKGKKDEGAGDLLKDWKITNAQWVDNVRRPLMRTRVNVLVCAQGKSINPEFDSADIKELWGSVRMKPDAQKGLGYDVRTCAYIEVNRGAGGGRMLTIVKDWGREESMVKRQSMSSFTMTYLKGVAGWTMQK